jgi:hypothetical protein
LGSQINHAFFSSLVPYKLHYFSLTKKLTNEVRINSSDALFSLVRLIIINLTNSHRLEKQHKKVQREFSRLLHFFLPPKYSMVIGQYPKKVYLVGSFSHKKMR